MAGPASTAQDLAAQHVAQFESFITHATEPGGPLAQLRSIVCCSQQEAASSHHAIRVSGSDISDYDHALGNALMQQPLAMLPRLDEALRAVVLAPRPTATPSCTAPAPDLMRTLRCCPAAGEAGRRPARPGGGLGEGQRARAPLPAAGPGGVQPAHGEQPAQL